MAKTPGSDLKPIIIRRTKKVAGGHHGGAWKIAYADFVTAMMAFFLLMWLLGSTTKGELQGIAEYFRTPLKVAMLGGSGSGDSSSIIKGGGTDLTRSVGQVKQGETEPGKKSINLQAARDELRRKERERMGELLTRLQSGIDEHPVLRQFRNQIRMDLTGEGLRIQIVDERNRPMFDTGSARLKDYTREILRQIAPALNSVENRVALSGHTDAAPYTSGERGYSNWELSGDRANASRRELVAGGLDEGKIVRVVGLASSMLANKDEPLSPSNRRISIVVLTQQAAEAMLSERGEAAEVGSAAEAADSLQVLRPSEGAPERGSAAEAPPAEAAKDAKP